MLLFLAAGFSLGITAIAESVAEPSPVKAAASIRLIERGALMTEDFDGDHIDTKRWRIWKDDPQRITVEQQNGRLALTARGPVNMDGLSSLQFAKCKDVVLVGEMDVRSQGSAPHHLVLHLCGCEGTRSPDDWTEVVMTDLGSTARFGTLTIGPERPDSHQKSKVLDLPHPPGEGFLCRIELNGQTNQAELSVKSAEGWCRIGDPVDLPLRTVHTEVKFRGNESAPLPIATETMSKAWFDNVRIYPSPRSNYVGIRLVGAHGEPIWSRKDGGWPPTIRDASGRHRSIEDLHIELRTEDGTQVVASQQSKNMGFYLLPLKDAPWDVYPVAAQIRVLLDGKVLGKPLQIERASSKQLEGLYPDDVYNVVVE